MSDYTKYADEVDSAADVTAEAPVEETEVEEAPKVEAGTEVLEDGTVITDHIVTAEDVSSVDSDIELAVGDVVGLVANPSEDLGEEAV